MKVYLKLNTGLDEVDVIRENKKTVVVQLLERVGSPLIKVKKERLVYETVEPSNRSIEETER
jgi:hypothetical protein